MILYVAGPYRGDVEGNIRRAREVAIAVWQAGHVALCPHLNTAHFDDDAGLTDGIFLNGDLALLARCDGIVMMPQWRDSMGACDERNHALLWGKPIWYYPNLPEVAK